MNPGNSILDEFPEPPIRADSDSRSTNYTFTGQPVHPQAGPESDGEWIHPFLSSESRTPSGFFSHVICSPDPAPVIYEFSGGRWKGHHHAEPGPGKEVAFISAGTQSECGS